MRAVSLSVGSSEEKEVIYKNSNGTHSKRASLSRWPRAASSESDRSSLLGIDWAFLGLLDASSLERMILELNLGKKEALN